MHTCPMCEAEFDTENELHAHWTLNEIRPLGFGQKSYVLTVPPSLPAGGLKAASALEDAIQIVRARHSGMQFTFVPYAQKLENDVYATVSLLAIPHLSPAESVYGENLGHQAESCSDIQEIEPLRISSQCRSAFKGEWVRPAILSMDDINEIMRRVPASVLSPMFDLLLRNRNRLVKSQRIEPARLKNAFTEPIRGKYYRLARGVNRRGEFHKQLWEVIPKK